MWVPRCEKGTGSLLIVALVSISAMSYLGLIIRNGVPLLDREVLGMVRLSADSWLFPLVTTVNLLAGFPLWDLLVATTAVLMGLRRMVREALFVAATLTTNLVVLAFKLVFHRPRPSPSMSDLIMTSSFPSGHVTKAIVTLGVLVTVMAWRYQRLRVPAVILAALWVTVVGVSRVASGEHWPTDVLGGLLLGTSWLAILKLVWKSYGRV